MKTIKQASIKLGITRQRVHQLIREEGYKVLRISERLTLIPNPVYKQMIRARKGKA